MAVRTVNSDRSYAPEGLLILEVRDLLRYFSNAYVSFVHMKCNNVAHYLARLAYYNKVVTVLYGVITCLAYFGMFSPKIFDNI